MAALLRLRIVIVYLLAECPSYEFFAKNAGHWTRKPSCSTTDGQLRKSMRKTGLLWRTPPLIVPLMTSPARCTSRNTSPCRVRTNGRNSCGNYSKEVFG